jgi:uracil-DNA glycosylase family 4
VADGRSAERELRASAEACEKCPQLVASRSQVVFGGGDVNADLMFVGEAPGASEDRDGVPFIGASGKLLGDLLTGIGMTRDEVYIANVLKCRPPENRDPRSDEIANCSPFLLAQVELVEPIVVVTLGNFATKLLREDDQGITVIHGQPELRSFGRRTVWLYPVFHPAAALYRRPNLELLREDFSRLPQMLADGPPDQAAVEPQREAEAPPARKVVEQTEGRDAAEPTVPKPDGPPQLDLF